MTIAVRHCRKRVNRMRLIDVDEIRIKPEYMHDICGVAMIRVEDIARILNDMPTIQSEPEQKRSKWIYSIDDIFPMDSQMECRNCHASYLIYLCNEFKFCPNCGARMEGEEE